MSTRKFSQLIAILLAAFAFVMFGPRAADALTVAEIQKRGFIVIGLSDQNPPYATLDKSMQNSGLEVDLGKLLAQSLKVEMRTVIVTSANRIACLLTECADVLIHSLTITGERASQVWFTQPYAENVFGIVGPVGTSVKSVDDLAKLRVGVIRAAFGDPILTQRAPRGTVIQRYDDLSGLLQAMLSKQVDVIAENSLAPSVLNGMQSAEKFENKIKFTAGYWGMAIRQDQPNLLQYLNAFLFIVKSDGTMDGLYRKYLNVPMPVMPTY
jgi:polar amino acid transport system substrate-binding protein